MAFSDALRPAGGGLGAAFPELVGQRAHARGVGGKRLGTRVHRGFDRHRFLPSPFYAATMRSERIFTREPAG
jgi:hypothetical protein